VTRPSVGSLDRENWQTHKELEDTEVAEAEKENMLPDMGPWGRLWQQAEEPHKAVGNHCSLEQAGHIETTGQTPSL
jgi:hypothetical protein